MEKSVAPHNSQLGFYLSIPPLRALWEGPWGLSGASHHCSSLLMQDVCPGSQSYFCSRENHLSSASFLNDFVPEVQQCAYFCISLCVPARAVSNQLQRPGHLSAQRKVLCDTGEEGQHLKAQLNLLPLPSSPGSPALFSLLLAL